MITFFLIFSCRHSPLKASVQFDVRPDICVSGTSPESVSRLLGELAQYGTHYLRLSRFSLSSGSQKGLVFQVTHAVISYSTPGFSPHNNNVTQMLVCVCVSGLHRWAAALPALLQSVCAEHTGLSESANYRLSFPQTGASAQVNLPSSHAIHKAVVLKGQIKDFILFFYKRV